MVAESLEGLDDDRLSMVSITGCEVDRDLQRAVIWFTSLDHGETEELSIAEAFDEHARKLRRAVGEQTRLRRTPELLFRPDMTLRSAERIEKLLDGLSTGSAGPDPDSARSGPGASGFEDREA